MSVHDDEQMWAAVWNCLLETRATAREGAAGQGLTDGLLPDLRADQG